MKASVRWAVFVAVSALAVACNGGGGGEEPIKPPPPVDVPEELPPPAPTPIEHGPIWLEAITTEDGTNVAHLGECLGFEVRTDTYEFAPGATVALGPLGTLPTLFLGPQRLKVGAPVNDYACVWTKIFQTVGTWDLTVDSGADHWVFEDAIVMEPPIVFDVGLAGTTRLWTLDRVPADRANVFERPYDADVYRINFQEQTFTVYDQLQFFETGAAAIVPTMEMWDPTTPSSYLGRGGFGLIFPQSGLQYVVVRDELGAGGPGATYDVGVVEMQLGGTSPSDTCWFAPQITPTRGYHANYDTLTNTFDPDGACADSIYGGGVRAPGNDGVWRVTIPAGKQLRVSTYDDHIDNVTYLLPLSAMGTSTSGCPTRPTNCVRAASRFGGGNTDTMIFDNTSGAGEEEFFLIHDSATVMTNDVGSFLIDVELYDR